MGPLASLSVREGDIGLVACPMELCGSLTTLMRVPEGLRGGHRKVDVPNDAIRVFGYSTNGAYEAMRVLMQKVEQLTGILLRASAEVAETGQGAGAPSFEAIRVAIQYTDQLQSLGACAVSEIRELGILTGDGKKGLVL